MDMDTDGMDMTSDMAGDMSLDMTSDMASDMMVDMGVDMAPDMVDMACEPESEVQFCARNNYSCGELVAEDNCGEERTTVCGESCGSPQECLAVMDADENVLEQSCQCNTAEPTKACNDFGKLCGALPAPCEGIVCDNFCVDTVASGGTYNCAVGSGKLQCWGNNTQGQLGLGNKTSVKNPKDVEIALDVISVEAGQKHSCAILSDTSLVCWGLNEFGQLGVGTTVNQLAPVLQGPNSRTLAKGVAKVAIGSNHTCALVDDDFDPNVMNAPEGPFSAYCWGSNESGAIGNPDRVAVGADAGTPIRVKGMVDRVIDIATGYEHTCVIANRSDNMPGHEVLCWGGDAGGQLGSREIKGASVYNVNPNVTVGENYEFKHYYMVNRSNMTDIVVSEPSRVRIDQPDSQASLSDYYYEPTKPDDVAYEDFFFTGNFTNIVAGETSTCVLSASGDVWCWGVLGYNGASGECRVNYVHGVKEEGMPYTGVVTTHTEYYKTEGTTIRPLDSAHCAVWPLPADSPSPPANAVTVPNSHIFSPTVVMYYDIVVGNYTTYGLPSGSINFNAVAPRPALIRHHPSDDTIFPGYLQGGESVKATQISAKYNHICMLLDDAQHLPTDGSAPDFTNVYCLGNNEFGELGDGTNSKQGYPISLTKDTAGQVVRALEIDVGNEHSCALAENNNIQCWGSNNDGQIGNENLMNDTSFRPFDVLLQ